ncbi:DNA damage-inducible protein DinB [Candidatus Nanopelagicaceae bacterium]
MDMEKILKHMAWANQEIIGKIAELPREALDAYVVNPEWTVGTIVRHIGSASNWYLWRLLDREAFTAEEKSYWDARLKDDDEESPKMQDINYVLDVLRDSDAKLLEQSRFPDADVPREFRGEQHVFKRSTILSQTVHHATEHRAQAVAALEARGFTSINLDDFDVWSYQIRVGE